MKCQDVLKKEKKLANYITNLQQENDDLKNRLENAVADCNLRLQENERLKEQYNFARKLTLKETKKAIDYKSRCEKAIEYIKEHYPTSTINDQDDKYNLLNILQNGSDKDDK